MQRIEISKTFPFSVDKLFDFLSDHENLELIFAPAKIQRIKEGKDSLLKQRGVLPTDPTGDVDARVIKVDVELNAESQQLICFAG